MIVPKIILPVTAAFLILVLVGCTSSPGFQSEFEQFNLSDLESVATARYLQIFIETDADVSERIKIAEDAVEAVKPGLKDRIAYKFPKVKPWQIETISITPKSERLYWLETSSWTYSVYVEVSLGFSGDDAWPILQYCGEEIQTAIQNVAPSSL